MLYDVIRELAKKQGIPIYKIEEDCGFSQGSMCKWNEVSPAWDKVQKVADYLGVPISELLPDKK